MSEEVAPVPLGWGQAPGPSLLGWLSLPGGDGRKTLGERWTYSFLIWPLPLRWIKELRPKGRWPGRDTKRNAIDEGISREDALCSVARNFALDFSNLRSCSNDLPNSTVPCVWWHVVHWNSRAVWNCVAVLSSQTISPLVSTTFSLVLLTSFLAAQNVRLTD